ncbi:hypothetical protein WME75_24680 [Sorangium sp. So ce1014]|uniref:hypothetical protein n=1 Tax=Sorangium sp. So ce1014 TaxID=3133326 RepID=UPI003F638AFB
MATLCEDGIAGGAGRREAPASRSQRRAARIGRSGFPRLLSCGIIAGALAGSACSSDPSPGGAGAGGGTGGMAASSGSAGGEAGAGGTTTTGAGGEGGAGGAGGEGGGGDIAPVLPEIHPEVFGTFDTSELTVFAFSQVEVHEEDPQVLELAPDMVPRAWQRWRDTGIAADDYDAAYPASCRERDIRFVAGSTASVIFEDEVDSEEQFLEQTTRNAAGELVAHDPIVPGAHRSSMASPSYRARLIEIGKLQIDLGVDGLTFDEINGGYGGAQYDGNEGFDDHHVADFGNYLCRKHGGRPDGWQQELDLLPEDGLDCGGAPETAGRSFDFRGHLQRMNATVKPFDSGNKLLLEEWGWTVGNRPDPQVGTFVEVYPALVYWQEVVLELRRYAREQHGREIFITSNGIIPFVDLQSVGLYDWNIDGDGPRGMDWVPIVDGHLDGTVSFQTALRGLKARSKRVQELVGGKEVPLMLFLDWPNDMMNRYYALPLEERKDYFRVFAAEVYANGLYFALPLHTTTDENTATALEMMEFFARFRDFYRSHADLVHGATDLTGEVTLSFEACASAEDPEACADEKKTSHNLAQLPDGRTVLHVINHVYSEGVVEQEGLTASFPLDTSPTEVTVASIDFEEDRAVPFSYAEGVVTVQVGSLPASVAIVVE